MQRWHHAAGMVTASFLRDCMGLFLLRFFLCGQFHDEACSSSGRLVRLVHPRNALSPIAVTESGITVLLVPCISVVLFLTALPPEVGARLHDLALLHPAVDDGAHHRRLVAGQTQAYQVFLGELLGEGIEIADVAP